MEVLIAALIVLVIILSIQVIRYEKELRRMARFLRNRGAESNATMKAEVRSRGVIELAHEINQEFENQGVRRLEGQRQQNDLQSNLAHLSHDIRTPLTGAYGYMQLLEEETDRERQEYYRDSVIRRLNDLNHLLDQLFMFTQINDPEYDLELETVDSNEILSEVLLSCYPQFKKKGIEPLVTFESERIFVCANKEALIRIMQNLITNMLRYGVGSPSITQSRATYRFTNLVENPNAIDEEKIFERFYKGDVTRAGQGSGLGLAIVTQLAAAINARVSVELVKDSLTITLKLATS